MHGLFTADRKPEVPVDLLFAVLTGSRPLSDDRRRGRSIRLPLGTMFMAYLRRVLRLDAAHRDLCGQQRFARQHG
ncbi:hypothetical protein [Streptomyces sp. NPDC047070]|uniref:hypothetical protein n=1 Tax=Streptomyces sp. NPDC047070 TaxID=3154923 RepID=UPI003451E604